MLAAAMRAHAHFAPLSTIEGLEVFGSTLHARALQHPISGSGCCRQVHRARCWCIVHHLKAFGLLAPAPEDRPPPMHPPTPAEHMQCELRKCAFNSSEQHDRHAIQPTEHLPTTCRQPPCCSRCSVLAAAMAAHAHQCRPERTCSGARIGALHCSQAKAASVSWSGDPSPLLLCSFG